MSMPGRRDKNGQGSTTPCSQCRCRKQILSLVQCPSHHRPVPSPLDHLATSVIRTSQQPKTLSFTARFPRPSDQQPPWPVREPSSPFLIRPPSPSQPTLVPLTNGIPRRFSHLPPPMTDCHTHPPWTHTYYPPTPSSSPSHPSSISCLLSLLIRIPF